MYELFKDFIESDEGADFDFADDTDNNADSRYERHSRFFRSLKEDTLIIIDNFDIVPTPESGFVGLMQYRCKILFTTRCRFSEYAEYELKEMPQNDLIGLVSKFYDKTEKKLDIVEQIIDEVHRHTLSVELAARLLASGILRPKKLLAELKKSKSIYKNEDKINIVKDGKNTKATYYEHIHKLMYIAALDGEGGEILKHLTFVSNKGINKRLFARWLNLKNLNNMNLLLEYGLIQENEFHKIALHPLIKEITIDDKKPSIENCKTFIENMHGEYLLHGIDLPYYKTMFEVTENIIYIADKDDIEIYKAFIKDAFAYMEKYAYKSGMSLIISELGQYSASVNDTALILDYKSAYEHIINGNMQKSAEYEMQAVNLCDSLTNPHLKANIYANMGEPQKAIQALEKCAEHIIPNTIIHAELLENIGLIYLQMNDIPNAKEKLTQSLNIYSEVWEDSPELTEQKISEIKEQIFLLNNSITEN